MLVRHVQGRSLTLRKTLYSGSTPTDPTPDSATVTITRADGTALIPAGGIIDEGTGVFSITLTPAETALLDRLTVTWSATFAGQLQTFSDVVEIAGDTFFTLAEARQVPPLNNVSQFSDEKIVAMRTRVEQRMEKLLGWACVPRYERESATSYGNGPLRLKWPFVRAVRSASVDGVAYTAFELALIATSNGFLYNGNRTSGYWPASYGRIIIGYEHGRDFIDEDLKGAALILTKTWLTSGPVDDRASSFSSVEGGTYSLVTPGRGGSTVGVPEVDAVIEQNRLMAIA